jgi:hypothetical protein
VKIVGVAMNPRNCRKLTDGAAITLKHEPSNPFDGNAMMVTLGGEKIGYPPKGDSERMFRAHMASTTKSGVFFHAR